MALKQKYTGKQVIRAGESLIDDAISEDQVKFSDMMDILSYWRFTHEEPLEKHLNLFNQALISSIKTLFVQKD